MLVVRCLSMLGRPMPGRPMTSILAVQTGHARWHQRQQPGCPCALTSSDSRERASTQSRRTIRDRPKNKPERLRQTAIDPCSIAARTLPNRHGSKRCVTPVTGLDRAPSFRAGNAFAAEQMWLDERPHSLDSASLAAVTSHVNRSQPSCQGTSTSASSAVIHPHHDNYLAPISTADSALTSKLRWCISASERHRPAGASASRASRCRASRLFARAFVPSLSKLHDAPAPTRAVTHFCAGRDAVSNIHDIGALRRCRSSDARRS